MENGTSQLNSSDTLFSFAYRSATHGFTQGQKVSGSEFKIWSNIDGDFLCLKCRCDFIRDSFDCLRGLSRLQYVSVNLVLSFKLENLQFGSIKETD